MTPARLPVSVPCRPAGGSPAITYTVHRHGVAAADGWAAVQPPDLLAALVDDLIVLGIERGATVIPDDAPQLETR
jgi:hypothetical protein